MGEAVVIICGRTFNTLFIPFLETTGKQFSGEDEEGTSWVEVLLMVSEVLESLFSPCRDCEVDFVLSMRKQTELKCIAFCWPETQCMTAKDRMSIMAFQS